MNFRMKRGLSGGGLVVLSLWALVAVGQFEGRAVSAVGEGVAAARVALYAMDTRGYCPAMAACVGQTTTDAAGRFSLAASPESIPAGGEFVAWVTHPQRGVGVARLRGSGSSGDIVCTQVTELAGAVVASSGGVAVGARVFVSACSLSLADPLVPLPPAVRPEVRTDVYGGFRIACPVRQSGAVASRIRLVARHPRWGFAVQDVVLEPDGPPPVGVKLLPYGNVAGQVQPPAPGADLPRGVVLELLACNGFEVPPLEIPVAADGAFRAECVPQGDYRLVLESRAAARLNLRVQPLAVTVAPGLGPLHLVPRLARPVVAEFLLSDGGEPLADAWLEVVSGDVPQRIGPSDAAGRIAASLPPGPFHVTHAVVGIELRDAAAGEIAAAGGEAVRVPVAVSALPRVTGVVRDEGGQPVGGATVLNLADPVEIVLTDDQGSFDLPVRGEVVLQAIGPAADRMAVIPGVEAGAPLEVRLPWRLSLAVNVRNAEGQALPGAHLRVAVRTPGRDYPLRLHGRSGKDGTIVVPAVAAGSDLALTLRHPDYAPVSSVVRAATVAERQDDMLNLVLHKSGVGVSGVVLDRNDAPMRDVCVQVLAGGEFYRKTPVDDAGRFVFENLPPGRVFVGAVSCDGVRSHGLLQVDVGTDNVMLRHFEPREPVAAVAQEPPAGPAAAQVAVEEGDAYYYCDFEDEGAGITEWSQPKRFRIPDGDNTLLGVFDRDAVMLTLERLPDHRYVRVSWDMYALDSWDGYNVEHGPDVWQARVVNGPRLVRSAFVSYVGDQSYPLPFRYGMMPRGSAGRHVQFVVPDYAGDPQWSYHVRYPMSFVAPHSATTLQIQFSTQNLSPSYDESWALDNVGVELLNEWEPRRLGDAELERAWLALASPQGAVARAGMDRLIAAADEAVAFLTAKLGWAETRDLRAELAAATEVFSRDERAEWTTALAICRDLGPRAEAVAAWYVDKRRAAGSLPPWFEQAMDLKNYPPETDPYRLREGRAVWVLERIWTPASRTALLLDEVAP